MKRLTFILAAFILMAGGCKMNDDEEDGLTIINETSEDLTVYMSEYQGPVVYEIVDVETFPIKCFVNKNKSARVANIQMKRYSFCVLNKMSFDFIITDTVSKLKIVKNGAELLRGCTPPSSSN